MEQEDLLDRIADLKSAIESKLRASERPGASALNREEMDALWDRLWATYEDLWTAQEKRKPGS